MVTTSPGVLCFVMLGRLSASSFRFPNQKIDADSLLHPRTTLQKATGSFAVRKQGRGSCNLEHAAKTLFLIGGGTACDANSVGPGPSSGATYVASEQVAISRPAQRTGLCQAPKGEPRESGIEPPKSGIRLESFCGKHGASLGLRFVKFA